MHEMLYKVHPFEAGSNNEIKAKIKAYKPNNESIIHSFISECLNKDVNLRLSVIQMI